MADETKDQVDSETAKEGGEAEVKQSEETKEEPITAEKAYELAQGLQKGYTMTRQDIAEIRENLSQVLEAVNSQKGGESETKDNYLTEGRLVEILSELSKAEEAKKTEADAKADAYVDAGIARLRAEGIIGNKTAERINPITGKKEIFDPDEEELIQYAINKKEPDLFKAAERWQEIKQAREEAKKETAKEVAKKETRQEEGSKVGTSSKGSEGSKGVNYNLIHNTDWSQL